MFDDTILLLKNYWRIDRRGDSKQSQRARVISLALIVIMGVVFSAALGYGAGQLITNPAFPLPIRLGTLPGILLTMALVATVFVGVNQAIRALYLTNDMELLISAPVRTEAVMTAKLLSRLPGTTIGTLVLTIPALFGFGIASGLGPAFYIAGTIALLLAPLFGLSAGALLAMVIVRILPAQRVSEYLGAASILLGVLIAIAFQLPRLMFDGDQSSIDPGTAEALSGMIESVENLPLPSMWAGHGLVDLAQGRVVSALGSLSVYLLITAGFFAVTILVANRLYLSGWLRMQGSGITRGGYTDQAGIFGSSSVEAGIASKDWFLRLRDARQLASLASGVIFAIFFGFLMLRPDSDQGLMSVSQSDVPDFMGVFFSPGILISGIILYAGWGTFSRAAMTSLSLEGPSFYILKAAPVSPATVFRSKVLSLVLPFAVGSMLLLLISWFFIRFSALWIPYAWLCLVIIGYGMITISTALGFMYPRLDWEDPRRMTDRRAGLPNLLLNAAYGVIALIVAALPFFISAFFPGWTLMLVLVGLLILAGMAWLVERVGLSQVNKTWYRIELPG
ncbi:MAG: putative ABC transporter permease subunit [Candidatus Promineifilaceae bacterium]